MTVTNFDGLASQISEKSPLTRCGSIIGTEENLVAVTGLSAFSSIGDMVSLPSQNGSQLGEIVALRAGSALVLPAESARGCALNAPVKLVLEAGISPDKSWLGRVIDPFGKPLDRRPMASGRTRRPLQTAPPPAAERKRLGARLETGLAAFNTFLPLVEGQRLGLFAGSGVGKSTLLADICRGVEADVIVLALIGERGRELREFTEDVLGAAGIKKTVVVAATSDQSALFRRRAAWTSMSVAEHFRDEGAQVLYLCDSLTRFAEADREIAISCGEAMSASGYPPSTLRAIMALCERAGPGSLMGGDITAIFSVLVAGSDMEEPLADTVRGVLDGHVVLDRRIAERGRFPAIDVQRSISRSLPKAASKAENALLAKARASIANYADVELMLQAGLYEKGSNPDFDEAISQRPKLEAFLSQKCIRTADSYGMLKDILSSSASNPEETQGE